MKWLIEKIRNELTSLVESDQFKQKIDKVINEKLESEWADNIKETKLNEILKLERSKKYNSPNPWFEINPDSSSTDPTNTRYSWNQAFIADLREKGIEGRSDEDVIERWKSHDNEIQLKLSKKKEHEDRMTSEEPWVQVVGEKIGDDNIMALKLDWNPAFIKNLRKNGFTGNSEEAIVGKWLTTLSNETLEDDVETFNE